MGCPCKGYHTIATTSTIGSHAQSIHETASDSDALLNWRPLTLLELSPSTQQGCPQPCNRLLKFPLLLLHEQLHLSLISGEMLSIIKGWFTRPQPTDHHTFGHLWVFVKRFY